MPSRITETDYQYNIYNNYMEQLDEIMLKYSFKNSMPIQFWHIRADISLNHDLNNIQNAYKDYIYDIYHFLPTLEMSPLTYQIGPDETGYLKNVAQGSFMIYLIDKPLPGDLFKFYNDNDVAQENEIFRILNVRYIRTTKDKIKLYQLDFETSPMYWDTLQKVRVDKIFYWDTETFRFLDEEQYENFPDLINRRDELIEEINKYYDNNNGYYVAPVDCSNSNRPLLFLNTILRRLKKGFNDLNIKPQFGINTAKIPISWILNNPYWETFDCVNFDANNINFPDLFNLTEIINDNCSTCDQEFIDEVKEHEDLYNKVKELVILMQPFMTEDQINDFTCDKYCCDVSDINYQELCNKNISLDNLFHDLNGPITGDIVFSSQNGLPLFISNVDGPVWP